MNKPRYTRPMLDQAVAELNDAYPEFQPVPTFAIRKVAAETGYSTRQVRRVLARTGRRQEDIEFAVDDKISLAVFSACGNLALAHRILSKAGRVVPSMSTFQRYVKKEMGTAQIAAAKKGTPGLRDKVVYLPNQYPYRLHSVLLDHTELPIYVVPTGHKIAEKPWMTAVMDAKTRYVLSWVVTFGRPTSEEVRAALIQSTMVGTAPDGQTLIGGRPDQAVWDRGLEFLSDMITESCLRVGMTPTPLPAYSPHLKGRLERFWRFLKTDLLAPLPGYVEGPHDLRGHTAIANTAMSEDRFLTLLVDWFDDYNSNHVIAGQGQTPLQMWQQDATTLVEIPAPRLWQDFLQAKDRVKVSKKGVRFDRIDYIAPELNKVVDRRVEVRHLPHDRSFVEVFLDGEHLCTALPAHLLTADETEEFLAARQKESRLAKQRFSTANRLRRKEHPGQKLELSKDGTRHVIDDAPLDLLHGADAALDALLSAADDEDRLF